MKKIMIAACAAMIGIAANAVTYQWGFNWASASDGSDLPAGVSVYLVDALTYAQDAAIADLTAGKFDTTKVYQGGVTSYNEDLGAHIAKQYTDDSWAKNTSKDLYTVFVLGQNPGDKFAYTDVTTFTAANMGTTEVDFGYLFDDDAGTSAIPWGTVAAVPEPTSGLLLLLGVAGLALRRRRA